MVSIGLSLLSIGIGLLGLSALPMVINVGYEVEVRNTGVFFAVAGMLIVVYWKLTLVYRGAKLLNERVSGKAAEYFSYEFRQLTDSTVNLKNICSLGERFIYGSHPDAVLLNSRMQRNSDVLCAFEDNKGNLRGYFIVYPLNKKTTTEINTGVITSGKRLIPEHLVKRTNLATSIYISMVAGIDRHARAFILYELERFLKSKINSSKRITHLYAKPTTAEGRRLLRKYKFNPIGGDSEIWNLEVGATRN